MRVTEEMVTRFLNWPLPSSVRPDQCVMDQKYPDRIGTNLLTADEARQMLEHVLATSDELSRGTYACDVCGGTTPHSHDPETVEIERCVRPAFEKTTVPRGSFNKQGRNGPYMDQETESLWQHFLSGWFAAKAHHFGK